MNIYDFKVLDTNNNEVSLSDYRDKVMLIVNTATHCGFTPQLEGLEALYEKYKDQGFEILGFPCNQFLFQAPESAEKIVEICQLKYGTTFKQFQKIKVNARNQSDLYEYMKAQLPNSNGKEKVEWNFEKFLIDRSGNVAKRYSPKTKPQLLVESIEELLK